MLTHASILKGVRTELGDLTESFRDSYRCTNGQSEWDLTARNVMPSTLDVILIPHAGGPPTTLTTADYSVDARQGILRLNVAPDEDDLLIVSGDAYAVFSDDELETFVNAALSQHLLGRQTQRRYRDGHGFIRYEQEPMELRDVPDREEVLIVLLTTIEALWALSTDASLDINVQTAEGTVLPRGQRYQQMVGQIELLTNKYKDVSLAMGVGLYAPEVFTMRRKSRSTGRLVPVYESQEYDEVGPPIRKLPPRSGRDNDPDGPNNPFYGSGGGGFY